MNFLTILHHFSPIIALFTLIIGFFAIFKPKPMAKNFGVPVGADAYPFVIATGVRDIFMGTVILILYFLGQWYAIALVSFSLTLVAVSDFVIVQKYGIKKNSWTHFLGALGTLIYGLFLLVYG